VLAAVSGTYQRFLWCSDRLFCAGTCHTCGQEHGQTFAREKKVKGREQGIGSRDREERTDENIKRERFFYLVAHHFSDRADTEREDIET
jgi:hypothetical protein